MMFDTQTPAGIFEVTAFLCTYSRQALETGKTDGEVGG